MTDDEIMELAKDFAIEGELVGFARVIEQRTVKKCIQQADNEASRFYDMDATDCGLAMLNFCQLLKEDFGVSDD